MMCKKITDEEFLAAKTDVTLEQLELFKKLGYEDKLFQEALEEHNITDEGVISQLSYAYNMGEEERFEASIPTKEVEENRTFTEEQTKRNAEIFFDPVIPLMVKHKVDKNPINSQTVPDEPLQLEFREIRNKIMEGDKEYLYTAILSQLGQMQQMSLKINVHLSGENSVDTAMKYSNMQLKLMAEQRRTIQALDDLMTPKKTTFVKEVSQHNHFSEKKSEIENEKQNALEGSSQSIDNNTEILEAEYVEK